MYQCSECNDGYYLMFRASVCSKYCPTGVTNLYTETEFIQDVDHNMCDHPFEDIGEDADDVHWTRLYYWNYGLFDLNESDMDLNPSLLNAHLYGGEVWGCDLGSDPIPIKDRGVWFDG